MIQQETLGYLFLSTGIFVFILLYRYSRKQKSVFNIGTIYIIGLIFFQYLSPSVSLLTNEFHGFFISNPSETGLELYLLINTYTILFFFFYTRYRNKTFKKIKLKFADRKDSSYLISAFWLTIFATILRIFVKVGLLEDLIFYFSSGIFAYSASISGWMLTKKKKSKGLYILIILIIAISLLTSLYGTFGRRNLVGILIALLWGIYYAKLRYSQNWRYYFLIILTGFFSLIFLAGITATRTHSSFARNLNIIERINLLENADFSDGIQSLFSGQDTGAASMWILENYPDNYPYNYLGSLKYAILYPIPRTLWKEKPIPLSNALHYQAGFRSYLEGESSTRGPGIIGHSKAEGGILTLILYAWLFGSSIGILDRYLKHYRHNIMVTSLLVVSIGYVLGLPRGDLGAGLFRTVFTQISVFIVVYNLLKRRKRLR